MKKQTLIYLYLITLFPATVVAETLPNPFTPHVFIEKVQPPMPVSSSDFIGSTKETEAEEQTSVHPLKAFDVMQYSVKGVVLSKDNSIVILNVEPGKDYFVYKGDVIGSGGAIIEKVLKDGIILIQDEKEIVIKVRNIEKASSYGY